jgi:hypothetical protein
MRRLGIHPVLLFCSALLLAGCSLVAADDPTRTGRFEARDLDGFFSVDSTPSDVKLDLSFSTIPGNARLNEVEGMWDDGQPASDACFDSFAASFLVSDDGADDDFAYIAVGKLKDPSSYASVDGRVFASTAAAAGFFETVRDAAEACSAAGGYELFTDDEQVWASDGVTVGDAATLDLPAGVGAIVQEEQVEPEFASGYRVYMLQRDNLVVGVTVQVGLEGAFDFADGDALVESIGAALGGLR